MVRWQVMGVRHCEHSEAISQGFRTREDCFGLRPRNDVSLTFTTIHRFAAAKMRCARASQV